MSFAAHILCIETSAGICSVAIGKDGNLLCQAVETQKNSAADKLQSLIDEVICQSGFSFSDIDAIAVSGGPGSYTGLRIGVSTAKGMAYALGKPLIHIESFQAMKEQLKILGKDQYDIFIPMLDARRQDAFTCVMDKEGNYLMSPQCVTVESATFDQWTETGKNVIVWGQDISKFKSIIADKVASFEDEIYIFAGAMTHIANDKFVRKMHEDIAYYEPKYYKSFHSSIK